MAAKTLSKEEILDGISSLSVLELAELVKSLEEKFGVSAAAPVAVAAAPVAGGGAAAGSAEEPSTVTITLKESGPNKINVIKVVREVTTLGLKEAKDLVDGAPKVVPVKEGGVTKEEAASIKKKFEDAGAKVEIK